MTRAIRPTLLLLLAAVAIAAMLLITGALRNGPAVAGAATRHHQAVHRTHAAKHRATHAARAAAAADTESADGETADAPDAPDAGEQASSEPAGETADGHQDAQGEQVDHQCPPDCADGETP